MIGQSSGSIQEHTNTECGTGLFCVHLQIAMTVREDTSHNITGTADKELEHTYYKTTYVHGCKLNIQYC